MYAWSIFVVFAFDWAWITYQSWDLVIQAQSSANTTKMLQAYIGYLLGPGQQLLPSLGYAALPASLDTQAKAQLDKIGTL